MSSPSEPETLLRLISGTLLQEILAANFRGRKVALNYGAGKNDSRAALSQGSGAKSILFR
jgi:hypothetical protein